MGEKQCTACGELVAEAKAFCPGCGNAFVEEKKRAEASEFERSERTVQFGQTMYNKVLSEMGLNISNPPNREERRVEPIAPVETQPAMQPKQETPSPDRSRRTTWILIAAAIVLVGLIALFLVIAAAVALYFMR